MKHLVFYSGGVCSWCTARAVLEQHPPSDVELVFTAVAFRQLADRAGVIL